MSGTPEKDVFINVIVACVTKHGFNGMLAAKELSEVHAYPLEAAAFAALLGLTYLDAAPGVARLLKMASEKLAEDVPPAMPGWNFNLFDLLNDASVANVINAWSRAPAETVTTNPTTQLVQFALDYRAYSVIGVLLGCEQVAAQVSLSFFRAVMRAVANEIEQINKNQTGDDVLVHLGDETLARARQLFEDGGVHALTEACNLIYRFNERRAHVIRIHTAVPGDANESSRLNIEIAVARGRTRNDRILATANTLHACLERVTAEERDLLVAALTEHKTERAKQAVAANIDPDEDYDDKIPPSAEETHFNDMLQRFDEQARRFDEQRHSTAGLPWRWGFNTEAQVNACTATITALRNQLALATALAKANSRHLDELERTCTTARDASLQNGISELREQLLNLDPDEYIQ